MRRRLPNCAPSFGDLRNDGTTRPTAVDLFWAIERFKRRFEELARAAEKNGAQATSRASGRHSWKKRRKFTRSGGRLTSGLAASARNCCHKAAA